MAKEFLEIVVECEDGTDPLCIDNDCLLTVEVEKDGLTDDQIQQLKDEEDEYGFISRETLEEIRDTIDDEEWASETTCIYCGSDSDFSEYD